MSEIDIFISSTENFNFITLVHAEMPGTMRSLGTPDL